MKLFHLLLLIAMLIAFSLFMNHESKPLIEPNGNKIKVGIIAPFSGMHMRKGESALLGIKVAQALKPYLDNGDEIELIEMNDQGDPELSILALRVLAKKHKVVAVLTFSDSNSVLAMAKVADRYKIPVLVLLASHPDITKDSSFINQFNFDDTFQASVAALYVRDELLLEKVAIITQPDNVHFSYLANKFSQQFSEVDGEITDTISLTADNPDYIKILESIKYKDPELLYLPIDVRHLFNIKIALTELGWNPVIMVSDGIVADAKEQTKYPVNMLDGLLAVDAYSYDMHFTSLGEQLLQQMAVMGVDLKIIGTHSALGMEGYIFLIQRMNQCTEATNKQACINAAIRSPQRFEGIKGFFSFDSKGKASRSLVINRMHNGEMDFIVQVY